jgi:electron transfer flavoprotein beta subunit
MKIICLIKYVPNMEDFKYDYDRNVLIREKMNQILNPEDACAVAFALSLKKSYPNTEIEVVSMGPQNNTQKLEDLLRLNVDHATLISDLAFVGSDTYATSKVLSEYIKKQQYDVILSGTHTLDGDTSHVPAQVAQWLDCPHVSNIINIKTHNFESGSLELSVDCDHHVMTYEALLPAVLSIQKEVPYKLPYVRYEDLNRDVSDRLKILSCVDLNLSKEEVGFSGSKTKVTKTFVKTLVRNERIEVLNDDAGIHVVYEFLKEKGFIL